MKNLDEINSATIGMGAINLRSLEVTKTARCQNKMLRKFEAVDEQSNFHLQ